MRSFLLITVMHSGTQSVKRMAERAGYEMRKVFGKTGRKEPSRDRAAPAGCYYWHPVQLERWASAYSDLPLITTLRDEDEIRQSWMERYGKEENGISTLGDQLEGWRDWVLPRADIVIPLREPEGAIEEMAALLEIDPDTLLGKGFPHERNRP